MHLVFFIYSLDSGGAERVMSELASERARKGDRVTVITLSAHKPFYPLDKQVDLIQLKKESPVLGKISKALGAIYAPFVLRKHIQKLTPDLVISFIDLFNIMAIISMIGLNIPLIISERTNPFFRPLSRLTKYLRLLTYPQATKLVIQTENAASYFKGKVRRNTEIIPNAVKPASMPKTAYAKRATQLISIGRLDQWKDHKTAILAVAKLIHKHPDLSLSVYGTGVERENLLTLIKDLDLEKHVFLKGLTQDVPAVLQASDLYLFPTRYEGFPNALCEAMAMGLPVIASNIPGNSDLIQEGVNGLLFNPGDVEAMVRAIEGLLDDQEKRASLGQEAQKLSQIYSPTRIFNMWNNVISEAVSSG